MGGRGGVAGEDLRDVAVAVLTHRIALGFEAEARGRTADQVIADVLASVQVPGDDVAVLPIDAATPAEDADHG